MIEFIIFVVLLEVISILISFGLASIQCIHQYFLSFCLNFLMQENKIISYLIFFVIEAQLRLIL